MTIRNVTAAVCTILECRSVTKDGKWPPLLIVALLFSVIIGILGSVQAAWAVFPDHPIRLIFGSPPGSNQDIMCRMMADKLLPMLGQPIVVESRPGSNGIVAADLVAKAKPDGYTLIWGMQGTFAANKCMYSDLPYDPIKDFAPVILFFKSYPAFVVTSKLPVHSVTELVAYAKAHPGLKFGHTGTGQPPHLAPVAFASRVGIKLVAIPYTSVGEMFTDLTNGEISLLSYTPTAIIPLIEAGKVRPLATTGAKRMPIFPNVPTMIEAGVPNFTFEAWNAFFAPAGTPKDVIQVLYKAFEKVMKDPAIASWFERQGYAADLMSPDELAKFLPAEIERVCKLVESVGAKVR